MWDIYYKILILFLAASFLLLLEERLNGEGGYSIKLSNANLKVLCLVLHKDAGLGGN